MGRKKNIVCLLAIGLILNASYILAQRNIYLIPTLHKLHIVNQKYTYDSLQSIITKIDPDIIAVEIRSYDIDKDSSYLKKNYPYEMWMMHYWFREKIIMGFDWLGDALEGKTLYENWKEDIEIKKVEKALAKDSVYSNKIQPCTDISKERLELLKTLSLFELLESKDVELTNQFYACLADQLRGSEYEKILQFYVKRNNILLKNIRKIIRKNKGKKIVILTGDDHYVILKDILKSNNLNYR